MKLQFRRFSWRFPKLKLFESDLLFLLCRLEAFWGKWRKTDGMPRVGSSHVALSASAGLAGALASVAGKFALGDLPAFIAPLPFMLNVPSSVLTVFFRTIFVLSTVLLNAVMWIFYTKALRLSGNSLQALAINTACNFIGSAAFGLLLFGDDLTASSMFGMLLMLLGVVLINTGNQETGQSAQATRDKVESREKKRE